MHLLLTAGFAASGGDPRGCTTASRTDDWRLPASRERLRGTVIGHCVIDGPGTGTSSRAIAWLVSTLPNREEARVVLAMIDTEAFPCWPDNAIHCQHVVMMGRQLASFTHRQIQIDHDGFVEALASYVRPPSSHDSAVDDTCLAST